MVFERITNALGSGESDNGQEFEGVVGEAMEEYEILESEYQSDDFFQEKIRKIVEEEDVSVDNLNAERGAKGKKLGKSVKLLGVIAEGIAIKTVVEVGISKVENDLGDAEERIETQDSELFRAENQIEELEIRAQEMIENEFSDIKSTSDLESSISTIEENTGSLTSMLEDSSIKEMNEKQNEKLGNQLKTVIQELDEVKQHDSIVSLENKVREDHINAEIFQELASEAFRLSEKVEVMEQELNSIEKALELISESLVLVENNSEIWTHNENISTIRRTQQIVIVEVLEDDSRLDNLSDFTSFNKQDFLTQLSSKNPGDLISESQEFRSSEVDRFESRLEDLKDERDRLEQEKGEIENQLQNIAQKASQIIEELESIEEYIEKLKQPSKDLVRSIETEISDVEKFRSKLESYKEKRDQGEVSQIPEMERLISHNQSRGSDFDAEGVFQRADELLRSATQDLEELISTLDAIEDELFDDEESLKKVMQRLNNLDI